MYRPLLKCIALGEAGSVRNSYGSQEGLASLAEPL